MVKKSLVLIILFVSQYAYAFDPNLPAKLGRRIDLLQTEDLKNSEIGFSLIQISTSKELFSRNSEKNLIPASLQKLATSAAALKLLGAEYQFPTELFLNRSQNEIPDLVIRGYGDPSFSQTDFLELAHSLKQSGFNRINNIIVDDTLFKDPQAATGSEPYQAALSSASVNNNSFYVAVSPSVSGQKANVSLNPGLNYEIANGVNTLSYKGESFSVSFSPSSESYNPKNFGVRVGQHFKIPEDLVTINVTGRISRQAELSKKFFAIRNPIRYYASLFKYYLNISGVAVEGDLLKGETPGSANQIFLHKSKPLTEIIRDMNHYSSNFIAQQLVYAIGQDSKGYFDYNLGLEKMNQTLLTLGVSNHTMLDGSGLKRDNKISVASLTKLLLEVSKDYSIYPDFISSLSRFGHSGTLTERKLYESRIKNESPESLDYRSRKLAGSVWAKTGTLDGVSSIAGYLEDRDGDRMAFAMIINGEFDRSKALAAQDALIKEILGLGQEQVGEQ